LTTQLLVDAQLNAEGMFQPVREVTIRGKKSVQHIAETSIVLDRPAARKVNGKTTLIPGEALQLRLIIARVYDSQTDDLLSTVVCVEQCFVGCCRVADRFVVLLSLGH